jgi:hypothetical protein
MEWRILGRLDAFFPCLDGVHRYPGSYAAYFAPRTECYRIGRYICGRDIGAVIHSFN